MGLESLTYLLVISASEIYSETPPFWIVEAENVGVHRSWRNKPGQRPLSWKTTMYTPSSFVELCTFFLSCMDPCDLNGPLKCGEFYRCQRSTGNHLKICDRVGKEFFKRKWKYLKKLSSLNSISVENKRNSVASFPRFPLPLDGKQNNYFWGHCCLLCWLIFFYVGG